jgi:methylated-DNA-[protein]-cysteine S-methyltransferase
VDVGEHVPARMGHDGLERVAGGDVLAPYDERDLDPIAAQLVEAPLELVPLRRARGVRADGLVDRLGRAEAAVRAHRAAIVDSGAVTPTLVRYHAEGWGIGELWVEHGEVVWHELPRPRAEGTPPVEPEPASLAARLRSYFAGEPVGFDDVRLRLEGSPFQVALARVLRRVPRGEVVTYGELAALAGRPGAARAAGAFCARNGLSLFVPCHRVVAAGGIGSYGSLGVAYKRRLLALEGCNGAL